MVRKDLTQKMLERLSKVDNDLKEPGGVDDNTRLINSWKAATQEERAMLEDLVHDHYHEWKGSSAKYKEFKYEDFGVFTDKVLCEALGNIIKKKKDQIKTAANSKYHMVVVVCCCIIILTHSIVSES